MSRLPTPLDEDLLRLSHRLYELGVGARVVEEHKNYFRYLFGLVAFVAIALFGLTSCQPNPVVSIDVQPDGAVVARLRAVNNSGVAVGWYDTDAANLSYRVFEYNFSTGATTDISYIPADTPDLAGDTFSALGGLSINASSQVLGSVNGQNDVLYDPTDRSYTPVPCSGPRGLHALSDSGLIACGNSVYDSITEASIPVASPAGCEGNVT